MNTIITQQIQRQAVIAQGQQAHHQQQADQQQFKRGQSPSRANDGQAIITQGFQREHTSQTITCIGGGDEGDDGEGAVGDDAAEADDPQEEPTITVVDDDRDHPHHGRGAAPKRPDQAMIDAVIADMFNDPDFADICVPPMKRRRTTDSEQETAEKTTETGEAQVTDTEEAAKSTDEADVTDAANTSVDDIAVTPPVAPPTAPRKRDCKATAKATQARGVKQPCDGCGIHFWKRQIVQQFQVCHNCIKIVQAVDATAVQNGGSTQVVRIDHDAIGIQITCHAGHAWVTPFKAKQGGKTCRDCRIAEAERQKQRVRMEEQQERERIARAQEQMFRQAQEQFREQDVIDDRQHQEAHVEIDPHAQFIRAVADQIIAPQVDGIDIDGQAVQHRFVDAIIAIGARGQDAVDAVFEQIFDEIGDRQQQQRVIRRIKFICHPDKNNHMMAKDAF